MDLLGKVLTIFIFQHISFSLDVIWTDLLFLILWLYCFLLYWVIFVGQEFMLTLLLQIFLLQLFFRIKWGRLLTLLILIWIDIWIQKSCSVWLSGLHLKTTIYTFINRTSVVLLTTVKHPIFTSILEINCISSVPVLCNRWILTTYLAWRVVWLIYHLLYFLFIILDGDIEITFWIWLRNCWDVSSTIVIDSLWSRSEIWISLYSFSLRYLPLTLFLFKIQHKMITLSLFLELRVFPSLFNNKFTCWMFDVGIFISLL